MILQKETGLWDPGAVDAAITEASEVATSYITEVTNDGIKVHDAGDSSNYVHITSAMIDMVTSGISAIKAWVENTVAKIRIGDANSTHVEVSSTDMKVLDSSDNELAKFSSTEAQIGKSSEQHTVIKSDGLYVKDADDNDTGKIYNQYLSNPTITLGVTSLPSSDDPLLSISDIASSYNTFELPSNAKNGTEITLYLTEDVGPDPPTTMTTKVITAGIASSGTIITDWMSNTITYSYDGARLLTFLAASGESDTLYGIKYTIETQYLPRMKVGNDVYLGQQITSGLPNSYVRVDNGNVRIFNTPQFRALNEVWHEGSVGYTNSLMINGRDMFGGGKVIWRSSTGYYLTDQQTVTLNEPISSQPHGIILAWSSYDPSNNVARNYGWHFDFIPKFYLDFSEGSGDWGTWYGQGIYVEAPDSLTNNTVRRKYIYISDDSITGHANNSASGTGYANNHMVLRYVVGI